MNKHTPGPWHAVDGQHTGVGISFMSDGVYGKPYQVAAITADSPMSKNGWKYVALINGKSTGEIDADARLIAAAPELLEALEACFSALNNEGRYQGERSQASRALAKAKGTS
jgi:hypothetical protein